MQTMQARTHRQFKAMIQGSAVFIDNCLFTWFSVHDCIQHIRSNMPGLFKYACFLRSTIYEYEMYDPLFDEALVVSGRRQGQGPVAANDLLVEVRVKLGLRCFGGRGRGSGGLGGLYKD